MPDDDLILGWQYPMIWHMHSGSPGAADDRFNSMTPFGQAHLHIYGSLVSDGKEKHNHLNQNITSNAVHEVIGDDPVVDQFQIATRPELSGSYIDDFAGTLLRLKQIVGSGHYFPIIRAKESNPVERIYNTTNYLSSKYGSLYGQDDIFSSVALNSGSIKYPEGSGAAVLRRADGWFLTKIIGEIPRTQRFVRLRDKNRSFYDSTFGTGSFYVTKGDSKGSIGSSYGTMQTSFTLIGDAPGYSTSNLEVLNRERPKSWITHIKPKYYVNYRHYGHLSDNIMQGRDSRYSLQAYPVFDEGVTITHESPVDTKFCTASYFIVGTIDDNTSIKQYHEIPRDKIPSETFFASNLSQYYTSSIPFIDNEKTQVFYPLRVRVDIGINILTW